MLWDGTAYCDVSPGADGETVWEVVRHPGSECRMHGGVNRDQWLELATMLYKDADGCRRLIGEDT
jgi:hypothetical protein